QKQNADQQLQPLDGDLIKRRTKNEYDTNEDDQPQASARHGRPPSSNGPHRQDNSESLDDLDEGCQESRRNGRGRSAPGGHGRVVRLCTLPLWSLCNICYRRSRAYCKWNSVTASPIVPPRFTASVRQSGPLSSSFSTIERKYWLRQPQRWPPKLVQAMRPSFAQRRLSVTPASMICDGNSLTNSD